MHRYYAKNRKKLKKDMDGFLHLISSELEDATGQSYEKLLEEIWACYCQKMLAYFPYIGGDKASGTRNLTGAFCFVAMGEVCRTQYGMTLERWGELTTVCYRGFFDRIPGFARRLAGKLIQNPRIINKRLLKTDAKNALNAAENPGSFVTQTQPSSWEYPASYCTIVCPLANFAKDNGYLEYMPYICNLDYVMFEAFGVPFYREYTCAAGDGFCDFKIQRNAPVNSAWPCHGVTPGDPLK